MSVTIKDIAKMAGVSYSTVSRALNDTATVNSDKRELILKLADEMGYVPNQTAINLKKSRSHTIGLYFSKIVKSNSPFLMSDTVYGLYQVIGSKYSIVIKGIDMHKKGTLSPVMYDGIVVVLSQYSDAAEFIDEAILKQIPIAVINRFVDREDVINVLCNEKSGIKEAMRYLIQQGHRKIAVIDCGQDGESNIARTKGWQEAIIESGGSISDIKIETGNYKFESGYHAAKRLLKYKPTGILCFNDEMAFGAQKAIEEEGFRVPEDISLIGFDNLRVPSYMETNLTTVERNVAKMATIGMESLLNKIENREIKTDKIFIDAKLIIRKSVKRLN